MHRYRDRYVLSGSHTAGTDGVRAVVISGNVSIGVAVAFRHQPEEFDMKKDTISPETAKTIETIGLIIVLLFFGGGYINDKIDTATKQEIAKIDQFLAKR